MNKSEKLEKKKRLDEKRRMAREKMMKKSGGKGSSSSALGGFGKRKSVNADDHGNTGSTDGCEAVDEERDERASIF